jgi:hypothetical protein
MIARCASLIPPSRPDLGILHCTPPFAFTLCCIFRLHVIPCLQRMHGGCCVCVCVCVRVDVGGNAGDTKPNGAERGDRARGTNPKPDFGRVRRLFARLSRSHLVHHLAITLLHLLDHPTSARTYRNRAQQNEAGGSAQTVRAQRVRCGIGRISHIAPAPPCVHIRTGINIAPAHRDAQGQGTTLSLAWH